MQVRIHQILATILSTNGDSNKYIASKLAVIIQYISIQLFYLFCDTVIEINHENQIGRENNDNRKRKYYLKRLSPALTNLLNLSILL